MWGIKHESHHAQLFCESAGSILASENLHVVVCRYRRIITDKVSSHLTVRCRVNLSRVFRYQFCQRTTNEGIGIENTCPAQSDKSFQSRIIDRVIPESGCAFGCLRQNRSCRPRTPAQRKGRAFAYPLGRFWAPACRHLELPSCSWVRSGAGVVW